MASVDPHYCHCGAPFAYRLVDRLNRRTASGLKRSDRLKAIAAVASRNPDAMFWCVWCDGTPRRKGKVL